MHAYVVYESIFGNTEQIAQAIARGLGDSIQTTVFEVGTAQTKIPDGIDLLVLGGPTHAFGMSRTESRTSAATETDQALVPSRIGIREWIESLQAPDYQQFAAFSTKVRGPFPGSAAKAAAHALMDRGWHQIAKAENFRVHGKTGPLLDGELERARAWGHQLGSTVSAAVHVSHRLPS